MSALGFVVAPFADSRFVIGSNSMSSTRAGASTPSMTAGTTMPWSLTRTRARRPAPVPQAPLGAAGRREEPREHVSRPPHQEGDECQDERDHGAPLRRRERREAHLELPVQHGREGRGSFTSDLLHEAREVRAAARRTREVDDRRQRQRAQRRADEQEERADANAKVEQEHRGERERGHHGEHATDIGAPERRAVGDDRDSQHEDGERRASPPAHTVREQTGEQHARRCEHRVAHVPEADEPSRNLGREAETAGELQMAPQDDVTDEECDE